MPTIVRQINPKVGTGSFWTAIIGSMHVIKLPTQKQISRAIAIKFGLILFEMMIIYQK
jgi:hypothetical protein